VNPSLRRAVRIGAGLTVVAVIGAGAWFATSIIQNLGESFESVSLGEDETGYTSIVITTSTTTTTTAPATTTTLPPRDLEVRFVDSARRPIAAGIQVSLQETGTAGSVAVVRTATTDERGLARWPEIGASEVAVEAPTVCELDAGEGCLASPDLQPIALQLAPGLTAIEVVLTEYAHNATTSGVVASDEIWSGEVHLSGTVFVPDGVLLAVAAGTTVTVAQDDGADRGAMPDVGTPDGVAIWAEGRLLVRGTRRAPVTLVPEAEAGSWGGVFGLVDLDHATLTGAAEIRLFGLDIVDAAGPSVTRSTVQAGLLSIESGAAFHHNVVEATATVGGLGGVELHHNRFTGSGQVGCLELDGLSGHRLFNNVVVECPLLATSRPDVQSGGSMAPLVVQNNTFATIRRQTGPAVTIHNLGGAMREGSIDRTDFDTVPVDFRNNIVFGAWPEGVFLGNRPLHEASFFSHNGFFGMVFHLPRGPLDPDNNYTFAGDLQRQGTMWLVGVEAMDIAWREVTGSGWSPTARRFDVTEDPRFVDLFGHDFHLAEDSPCIDAGHPDLQDTDGGPSDLGAYGGPGGADWD
jgi:hypothetical protein